RRAKRYVQPARCCSHHQQHRYPPMESRGMSEMADWRGCFVIPTYNNPVTIRGVVEKARAHGMPVIVVDDGSNPEGREACAALARGALALVMPLPRNRGKGFAVKCGFDKARDLGFTHAMQIDGDGQHDLSHVPKFVGASQ